MRGLYGQGKPGLVLLAGPVLLLGVGLQAARGWDWHDHFYVGPPDPSRPRDPDLHYGAALPPDSAPPPLSSYHWPTFREALDRYGWFGRRACRGFPEPAPGLGEVPVSLVPPDAPQPEPAAMPHPVGTVRVVVPAGAHVWFDGQLTPQAGPVRDFKVSPPPGNPAAHEVLARWSKNGREVHGGSTIRVQAGQRVTVDFISAEMSPGGATIP
jgi:uncharacterized protein (TIGR03000 family)